MRRRVFLGTVIGAAMMHVGVFPGMRSDASGMLTVAEPSAERQYDVKPMAIGVMIRPAYDGPENAIARVSDLGMSNCFLDLGDYIGRFSPAGARQLSGLPEKHGVIATAAEIVGPGRLVWDFLNGPSTIGLVPPATRAARIDALKQTSDF